MSASAQRIHASSLDNACDELFAAYPLALSPGEPGTSTACSMTLMLPSGDNPQFFVLSFGGGEGAPSYLITPWGGGTFTGDAEDVIAGSVPFPRHGSLFGFGRAAVTVLIAAYGTPGDAEPVWSAMPSADLAESQWPSFIGSGFIGGWFWEYVRDGQIIPLDDLIAGSPRMVFWAGTAEAISSGCVAVARDITGREGVTLPQGRYVYYRVLRNGAPVRLLDEMLADPGRIDLAPRFRFRES